MVGLWLERLWEFLTGTEFLLGLLWTGLSALAVALGILVYSRWGRSRPLEKCLVLSALLHVWVAMYSMTVKIATFAPPAGEPEIRVALRDFGGEEKESSRGSAPVELPTRIAKPAESRPTLVPKEPTALRTIDSQPARETKRSEAPRPPGSAPTPSHSPSKPEHPPAVPPRSEIPPMVSPPPAFAVRPDSPQPSPGEAAAPSAMPVSSSDPSPDAAVAAEVPEIYRLRTASNRVQIAKRLGSTQQREDAVQAALQWLADNQEPDGSWTARRHGGGQETREAGRDRLGAGSRAETAITGLALLAFSASGDTHLQGQHQETVRRGLEFLLQSQAADGSLGGQGAMYEFMYCHGIATLALCESLGMTGDSRLRQPAINAIGYTLAAQDPMGGGWRYRPQEAGDTSQLGWQLMSLKSAELAKIPIPEATWEGALRFLESVSGGNHGGLAAYRPGERISRSMTAEALACRQFLGLRPEHPAAREAGDYILGEIPGEGQANLYYWYYATMAMYQLQGSHWTQWNEALQKTLLASQQTRGPLAGSWDPNTRWDGYGGRVYATALATLCLEAYYRFCPLHAGPAVATRPAR